MLSKRNILLLYCTVLLSVMMLFTPSKAETEVRMLTEYFDLVVSGNLESAYYLWTDECRERASRFGIEYTDIPLKVDCNSPIVRNTNLMRDYLQPPVKKTAKMPRGFTVLDYSALVDGKLIEHKYYARNINDYFWLTYPQQYYSIDWDTKQTKYFNIRYDNSLEVFLNPIALDEADKFIEKMAKLLKLTSDDLKLLKKQKIEYFYCENDQRVKDITGHLIKGTFDMPSNDIITAFFPHYHELVHLLINVKLKKLPLYTLPVFREGVAVHLAGRWGKAPKTLTSLGEFLLSQKFIELDSIISFSGFNQNASSDMAYPISGLFTGYLIDEAGMDNYLRLYLSLSGNFNKLMFLTDERIKTTIAEAAGKENWNGVMDGFDEYLKKVVSNAQMSPGVLAKEKDSFEIEKIKFMTDKNWVSLEISAQANDTVTGNILFGYDESLKGFRSPLFEEQYRGELEFEGYRYGIRFDRNEAGVYDYATNHLVAKYIWGLQPTDEYYNDTEHKLYFKFRKDVIDYKLTEKTEIKLLPN